MSRQFQLQLVQQTLGELGYPDLAEQLAAKLSEENHEIQQDCSKQDPISKYIENGNYLGLCDQMGYIYSSGYADKGTKGKIRTLFENTKRGFGSKAPREYEGAGQILDDDLHALLSTFARNEKALAFYLVARTHFLERILNISLGIAGTDETNEAVKLLQRRVSSLHDMVDVSDPSLPIYARLTKEKESAILLALAMSPPSGDNLEASFFTPDVLLTNPQPYSPALNSVTRLRNSLFSIWRECFGVSGQRFDGVSSLSGNNTIPNRCLSEIIHKATLYNEMQSLYHLPPRVQKAENSAHEYNQVDTACRDDLPIHLIHTLSHHTDEVWFTRFSPSGRYLATGSLDGTCLIYDVCDNFRMIAELDASAENELDVFSPNSYKPTLDKKKGIIYFSWEPHERYIITCCLDTVIRIWNIENIVPRTRITRSMNAPESASLVSCFTLGERMRTWPCEFLKYDKSMPPHFVVGSPDKVLKVFSIDGREVLDFYSDADEWSSILGEDLAPESTASADRENHVSSQGSAVNATRQTEPGSSRSSESKEGENGASQFKRINDFAITPDGKVLISANNDKQVFFYRIPNLFDPSTTTSCIASLSLNGRLTSCNISADGRYMLLSIAPEELQLWDISPLEKSERPFLKRKFFGQSQAIYMVRSCFGYFTLSDHQEHLVLSGSDDGNIYIWKLSTGQLITRVKGHTGLCNAVDWNRNYVAKTGKDYGMYWCSVGDDQLVRIWGPKEAKVPQA